MPVSHLRITACLKTASRRHLKQTVGKTHLLHRYPRMASVEVNSFFMTLHHHPSDVLLLAVDNKAALVLVTTEVRIKVCTYNIQIREKGAWSGSLSPVSLRSSWPCDNITDICRFKNAWTFWRWKTCTVTSIEKFPCIFPVTEEGRMKSSYVTVIILSRFVNLYHSAR